MKKIFLVIILLLCTSCYDYKEPNEVSLVNAIGIDYIDNQYIVTYEILNTNDDTKDSLSYTVSESDNNLNKAFNKLDSKLSRKVSLSHLDVLILSEELLNKSLLNISDYFLKNNLITTNFYLVLASNTTPKEILENKNEHFQTNAIEIKNLLKEINYSNLNQFDYLISNTINNFNDIYLYSIKLDKGICLGNIAILKQGIFSHYLDENETNILRLLNNDYNNLTIENNQESINITKSNVKTMLQNNKYNVYITIYYNLLLNDKINFETKLKKDIQTFLNKEKNNNIDLLNLRQINYINNIKNYENINKNIIINLNLIDMENDK